MTRVAILGASGYTALELIKLLLRHPEVEISVATSRQQEGVPLSAVHPSLTGRVELAIEHLVPERIESEQRRHRGQRAARPNMRRQCPLAKARAETMAAARL